MLKGSFFICLFVILTIQSFGQSHQIKKVTQIVNAYYNDGTNSVDTIVAYYDSNGVRIGTQNFLKISKLVKSKTIDSLNNKVSRKLYFSDGSIYDESQINYPDSNIKYLYLDNVPILKTIDLKEGKKLKRRTVIGLSDQYSPYYTDTTYEKNNCFTKKLFITTISTKEAQTDTFKLSFNKITRVRKELQYNQLRREWFIAENEKFNSKDHLEYVIKQNYHDFHKRYFKTRTRYYYNNFGEKTCEEEYDCYLRTITKRISFYYEY
jgi:hypothetical protein